MAFFLSGKVLHMEWPDSMVRTFSTRLEISLNSSHCLAGVVGSDVRLLDTWNNFSTTFVNSDPNESIEPPLGFAFFPPFLPIFGLITNTSSHGRGSNTRSSFPWFSFVLKLGYQVRM